MKCPFCNLNEELVYNHVIEETDNFRIITGVGALVRGYIIVYPKKHVNYMLGFSSLVMNEYSAILEKYRNIFKNLYGIYPIIFEHGTPNLNDLSASSVNHAHTHIFNHNYLDEAKILEHLKFKPINNMELSEKRNYIYYKNPRGVDYITYSFKPVSQIMRIFIAEDLGCKEKYDWKLFPFNENIYKTIEDLDTCKK